MENHYLPPRSSVEDIPAAEEKKDRPVVGVLVGLLSLLLSESLTMVAQAYAIGIAAFIRGESPVAHMRAARAGIEAGGGLSLLVVAVGVSSVIGGWVCARFARRRTYAAQLALLCATTLLGGISEDFSWKLLVFVPLWTVGLLLGSWLQQRKKA